MASPARSDAVQLDLLTSLRALLPDVTFESADKFSWSARKKVITYSGGKGEPKSFIWPLLHEAAHATLGHKRYTDDFDLLIKEVAAWQTAKELGQARGIAIDENHIQDCLDTYRDWLHQRSKCPACSNTCLQISARKYQCHNCGASWQVSASRMCRPYRLVKTSNKKSSE